MVLISTFLFVSLFRVVLSLFRGEKRRLSLFRSDKNEIAQICHHRNIWFWLACKAWQSIGTNSSITCLVVMSIYFRLYMQKEVLELFCILHLLDILSYKHTVCLVSHFHYPWGIFFAHIRSSSCDVSHKSVINLFITKCIRLFSGSSTNLI